MAPLLRTPHLLALVFLVLVAAVLRFSTIGARSYWYDEVLTVRLLQQDFGGMLGDLDGAGGGAPLYFLLAWPVAKVLGASEPAMRALPAAFGVATVGVAYLATRELGSRRAALIAAALAATSPFLVWQAQEARPYALVVLLGGASFACFVRSLRDPGGLAPIAWALASALLIATHYVAGLMVAVQAVWLLHQRGSERRIRVAVAPAAAVGIGFVPWALAASKGGLAVGSERDLPQQLLLLPAQLLVGPQPPFRLATAALAGAIAAGAAVALVRRSEASERSTAGLGLGLAAGTVVLAAVASLSGSGLVTTRYLSEIWIPIATSAGIILGVAGARRFGAIATAMLCSLFALIVVASAWSPKFDRYDWRGAAEALGTARGERAIVTGRAAGTELTYYRPEARIDPGVKPMVVEEIAVLALPPEVHTIGHTPRPPRAEAAGQPPPGFTPAGKAAHRHFTLVKYRAKRPTAVSRGQLDAAAFGVAPLTLVEPAGAAAR